MDFGASMDLYYKQNRSGCPIHGARLSAGDEKLPRFGLDDKTLKQVLNDVQTHHEQLLNKTLFDYTTAHLHDAIDKAVGRPGPDDPFFETYLKLKHNVARFAAYKTAHQVNDLRQKALAQTDADKQWQVAQAINNRYNVNWLRTEYVTSMRRSKAAKKWQQYQQDKDLYPYLKYIPSLAAEPRNEHKKLYGIIKHVDDPFWDIWLPPSDWNCQCRVKQVRSDEGSRPVPKKIKRPPGALRVNPGKTGQIITNNHPMIKYAGKRLAGKNAPEKRKKEMTERIETKFRTNYRIFIQKRLSKLKNKFYKLPDGINVIISKASIDKIISNDNKYYTISNALIYHINDILEKIKFIREEEPIGKRKINISTVRIYKYDNFMFYVWLLKGKNKYHILHSVNIKGDK